MAEHTQKPLISLTTADIGTDPATVEKSLLYFFKLAKSWGAILLLDEADVFLERRSATDLVRNNMVAIFLRTLEYYQGILFLTTNRIGTFDEAFLSRIDVPIYFPPLTDDQRAAIWGTFFAKLEKERQGKIRVSSDVRYYVKEDRDLLGLLWNGREIRSGSSLYRGVSRVSLMTDVPQVSKLQSPSQRSKAPGEARLRSPSHRITSPKLSTWRRISRTTSKSYTRKTKPI